MFNQSKVMCANASAAERLWHWKWNESHWLGRFTTSFLTVWCLIFIIRSLCHYINSIYVPVYSSQYHPMYLHLFLKMWVHTFKFQKFLLTMLDCLQKLQKYVTSTKLKRLFFFIFENDDILQVWNYFSNRSEFNNSTKNWVIPHDEYY